MTEFEQLTVEEQEKVIHELKNYSRNCMDLYAENFRREKIKSGKDLVYLGRVETERPVSYTHLDVYKRQPCNSAAFPFPDSGATE